MQSKTKRYTHTHTHNTLNRITEIKQSKKLKMTILSVVKDVEQQEFSCTAPGCVNWYIHFGIQPAMNN